MNWIVFALLAWLALGFEAGFVSALQLGSTAIAPSFVLVFLVFIALWARSMQALGASLVLGAAMDLLHQYPTSTGELAVVMGPWSVGCMIAGYLVINFRAMMFRRNPLAMGFLSALGAAVAQVVVLSLLRVRSSYDDIVLDGATLELGRRLASAVYTGVLAVPLTWALRPTLGWLGLRRPSAAGPGMRY